MTEAAILFGYVGAVFAVLWGVARYAVSVPTVLPLGPPSDAVGPSARPRTGLSAVLWSGLMAGLLPLCIALLVRDGLPQVASLLPGLEMELRTGRIQAHSDRSAHPEGAVGFPLLVGLLAAAFLILALASRHRLAFPFFAFHGALALLCLSLDWLLRAPIEARLDTVERLLTGCFWLVIVSQACFGLFARASVRQVLLSAASVSISAAAFCLGAGVLAFLGQRVDETGFMLISYLVVAYGVIAMHITGLMIVVSSPPPSG